MPPAARHGRDGEVHVRSSSMVVLLASLLAVISRTGLVHGRRKLHHFPLHSMSRVRCCQVAMARILCVLALFSCVIVGSEWTVGMETWKFMCDCWERMDSRDGNMESALRYARFAKMVRYKELADGLRRAASPRIAHVLECSTAEGWIARSA